MCEEAFGPAWSFDLTGPNVLEAWAFDFAGNSTTASVSFTVEVTADGAADLLEQFVDKPQTVAQLQHKLDKLVTANPHQVAGRLAAFENYLAAKTGKDGLTQEEADLLLTIALLLI